MRWYLHWPCLAPHDSFRTWMSSDRSQCLLAADWKPFAFCSADWRWTNSRPCCNPELFARAHRNWSNRNRCYMKVLGTGHRMRYLRPVFVANWSKRARNASLIEIFTFINVANLQGKWLVCHTGNRQALLHCRRRNKHKEHSALAH